MPTRKVPRPSLVLATLALAALPAAAFTPPVQAAGSAASAPLPTSAAAAPVSFVNLPSRPLPADHAAHRITVTYRNNSSADQTVAPQILVESPDKGPFLGPGDVRLELLAADGRWQTVPLGSQTGTLYTDLIPAKLVLHSHHTLTVHYRLTVTEAGQGAIEPRVALYA
ncbi:hypothetical protein [Kitasatospora aureofaciens]|uniref:hypothetical protein n=1 Tax=Kitasatospora aureofaciens TaxID=1894 RepID=UPI002108A62C|nr:hypothetical protein [Kitasatospora aureofaciens]